MKSIYLFTIIPALLVSLILPAQDKVEIKTEVHSNQQVFITGEDIWLEGSFLNGSSLSKSITVRLLDRNGNVALEKDLPHDQKKFSGYLTIAQNLVSDYYFLDCMIKGEASMNLLQPVMVINPKLPPAAGCQAAQVPESAIKNEIVSPLYLQTDKQIYSTRENVTVKLNGIQYLKDISITAHRNDRLNSMMQNFSEGFPSTIYHNAAGSKELEGHVIKARITSNGKPIAGVTLLAGIKGGKSNISSAVSDEEGTAKFLLPITFDNSQLIVTTEKKDSRITRIEIIRNGQQNTPISFPCLKLDQSMQEEIEERVLNMNITSLFYGNSTRAYAIPERDTTDFYGRPDQRYLLDEYVRFPNMEEVITEIIPEVRVKKDNGTSVLQVLNIPFKMFFNQQALLLVDGFPVANARDILEADPLRIRCIDVISRRYMMGVTEFPGIVHFKSYKNDLAGLFPNENSLITGFSGLQETASPQPPVLQNNRLPDLRNLLAHEQQLTPDSNGNAQVKFNTSDATGEYTVTLRAISNDGKIIKKQVNFEVK
jgi:hypothetical protein